jgi:hypothetical protein
MSRRPSATLQPYRALVVAMADDDVIATTTIEFLSKRLYAEMERADRAEAQLALIFRRVCEVGGIDATDPEAVAAFYVRNGSSASTVAYMRNLARQWLAPAAHAAPTGMAAVPTAGACDP